MDISELPKHIGHNLTLQEKDTYFVFWCTICQKEAYRTIKHVTNRFTFGTPAPKSEVKGGKSK